MICIIDASSANPVNIQNLDFIIVESTDVQSNNDAKPLADKLMN